MTGGKNEKTAKIQAVIAIKSTNNKSTVNDALRVTDREEQGDE
jgi:hypothetical protein